MQVIRLGWLGTRTSKFHEMKNFLRDTLGLFLVREEADFLMFRLPGGDHDYVEVFGPTDPDSAFYTTGPVVGFVVDDLEKARTELQAAGVELIGPLVWSRRIKGYGWFHFRGPDGNIYGMLQGTRALLQG